MGISFDCPHCRTERLAVFFTNPLDGGEPAVEPQFLWRRSGDSFETLSLAPSIDAESGTVARHDGTIEHSGHWHGYITNGEIQ